MTQTELDRMVLAILRGTEYTPRSPRAATVYGNLQQQIAEIHARGWAVELPFDWPDITTPLAGRTPPPRVTSG